MKRFWRISATKRAPNLWTCLFSSNRNWRRAIHQPQNCKWPESKIMASVQSDTVRYPGGHRRPFAPVQDFIDRLRGDTGLLRRLLMIGGVAIVAAASLTFWLMSDRYISSDDSYVQAQTLMVSTDVSGLVKTVNVREGESVKKGQILFTLDAHPFQIALDNARAQLAQVGQTVEATKADYQSMLSSAQAQQAQVALSQRN